MSKYNLYNAEIEKLKAKGINVDDISSDDGFISANQFRHIKNTEEKMRHPVHIYAVNENNDVKFHQLTHSDKVIFSNEEMEVTVKLHDNPNPNDNQPSYFLPKSKQNSIYAFGGERKKWNLSKENDKIMKKYRDTPFDK